jgi:hypothetical protein
MSLGRWRFEPFLVVAGIVAFVSCAPPRVDFGEAARAYRDGDYPKVQTRWTRSASLYHGVYGVVFVSGLLKSWDYRQAYLARAQERYAMSAAERERLERQERHEHERYHEVFVSVSLQSKRWHDFDKPDSRWRLALLNDRGDEVRPVRVERLKRVTPEVRYFFPFHNPFSVAYVVRFHKQLADGRPLVSPETRHLIFRLAGAPGKTELRWDAARSR